MPGVVIIVGHTGSTATSLASVVRATGNVTVIIETGANALHDDLDDLHQRIVDFGRQVDAFAQWRRALPDGPVAADRRPQPSLCPTKTPMLRPWPASLRSFAGR